MFYCNMLNTIFKNYKLFIKFFMEDIIKSLIIFYNLTMRVQDQLLYSCHNKMSELL